MNVLHAAFLQALAQLLQCRCLSGSRDAAKDRKRVFRLYDLTDDFDLCRVIESILRFAERNVIARKIAADSLRLIHDVDAVIFPFDILRRRKIGIARRGTEIHQPRNVSDRNLQRFQLHFAEILILNFSENRIPPQHTAALKQLLRDFPNLLFRHLPLWTRQHQKTQLFRLTRHAPEIAPFLLGEQ